MEGVEGDDGAMLQDYMDITDLISADRMGWSRVIHLEKVSIWKTETKTAGWWRNRERGSTVWVAPHNLTTLASHTLIPRSRSEAFGVPLIVDFLRTHFLTHILKLEDSMDIKKLSAKEFISSLYIYNKERKRLTFFDLNPAQADLLDVLLAHDRVIVPKARQLGISTLIRAYFFWKAYCAEHPRPYAVMSHTRSSAEGLNKMDKTFYRNLPQSSGSP